MAGKFELGKVVATPGVLEKIPMAEIQQALERHHNGDWGSVCEEDRETNNQALIHGDRLLSVYKSVKGTKFWIITEWDRSVTTILLPDEY